MRTEEVITGVICRCLATLLAAVLIPAAAQDGQRHTAGNYPEQTEISELIIRLESPDYHDRELPPHIMRELSNEADRRLGYVRRMSGGAHLLSLPELEPRDEAERITLRLSNISWVEYVSPNRRLYPQRVPDDPRFNEQWHYSNPEVSGDYGVNLPAAWDVTTGRASVIVAVIDSGLLPHADIDGNILDGAGKVVPGYDFISDPFIANDGDGRDDDPSDPGDAMAVGECGVGSPPAPVPSSWHGTHVTGTVGALTDNSLGVAGVGWNVSILPLRVLGKCGAELADVIDAMRWAVGQAVPEVPDNANPARVLNLSLAGQAPCSRAEQAAVDDVVDAGASVVVAAGNKFGDAADFAPGNCSGVITVHATRRDGGHADYSNSGHAIEISAPGGEIELVDGTFNPADGILSTLDGGADEPANDNSYAFYEGTSMAAPHVAGTAALMLSRNTALTPAEVLQVIQSTARPFPASSQQCDTATCGAGIVDAAAAVAAVPEFVPDTEPDPFEFEDQDQVEPGQTVTSNTVQIMGINTPADTSVASGEYSLGCLSGGFTTAAGMISNGETVCVRHVSASDFTTSTTTTLTIGGVSADFTSRTQADPGTSAGGGEDSEPLSGNEGGEGSGGDSGGSSGGGSGGGSGGSSGGGCTVGDDAALDPLLWLLLLFAFRHVYRCKRIRGPAVN